MESQLKTSYLYKNQFYPGMESHKSFIIKLSLFNLGLTAIATQIIMIREFLAIFQGNELIIGMFLGFWMLLTAAGSFFASKISSHPPLLHYSTIPPFHHSTIPLLQALLGIFPLIMLSGLMWLRSYFIPPGVMAGIDDIFLFLLLVLGPFCLVSGFLFPIMVHELSALHDKNLIHKGYALDAAGSIAGGLLFSLLFLFILNPFDSLLILTCTCFFTAIAWASGQKRKIASLALLVIGMVILVIIFIIKPVELINRLSFKNQQVLEVKASPFGKLTITRLDEQLNLYENGVPVMIGDDPAFREESVHYAMLLHPRPENVLLISGGTGGTIGELLKYPLEKIDYLEINPWMIRLIDKYQPFTKDDRVSFIYKDPRIILARAGGQKYDVIILNTPEPLSAELNRFYTLEFFQLLKDKLNPGGIISLSVPAAGNYMSETSRMMHSVLFNTLHKEFDYIRIIPGEKDYYLASETSLEHSFLQNYPSLGFTNLYVNPSYINEDLQKMRSDLIMKEIIPEAPVNSDLKPAIFSLFLKHWLSKFKIDFRAIPIVLAIFIVLAFLFLGPLNLGLFAGGFTASALEFLLLIWFQVMYGFVFQMTGVIFAVFMAGIAIGSMSMHLVKKGTFRDFLALQAAMAAFAAMLAILMLIIPSNSAHWTIIPLILVLVFVTGLLTGAQFSLSGSLRNTSIRQSSGESFSADLLGSAIGIALVSVYLIPQLGLPVTGIMLAGLNVVALLVVHLKGR